MHASTVWHNAIFDVLIDEDECAALAVIARQHPEASGAVVHLIEADLCVEEALAYARVLVEMGRDTEALDVFEAVLRSVAGCAGRAQHGQRRPGGSWFSGAVPQA